MRLKSYSAASMAEAMALIRAELGDDAIIVSTQRASGGNGVRITAALEDNTDQEIHQAFSGGVPSPVLDALRDSFVYHGLPPRLIERLIQAARDTDTQDASTACAAALDQTFVFAPLPERRAPYPFMLVGPPGAGKTITVAKLAARARLSNRTVSVISADSVRAGALEQLSAFTSILGIPLGKARGPESLRQCIADAQATSDLVFIDTPGLNPFLDQDLDFLRDLTADVQVEPVFVMAAGSDPVEATEIAAAFADLGATRLLATRLDMTRRLGAVLSAADAGQFMLCEVSITPHIANGLCNITPVSMARLLAPSEPVAMEEPRRPAPKAEPPKVEPARAAPAALPQETRRPRIEPTFIEPTFADEHDDESQWQPPPAERQEARPSFPVLDEWVFPHEVNHYKK